MPLTPSWTAEPTATYVRLQNEALASLANRRRNNSTKAAESEGLLKQVEKCVKPLLDNPRHPSLNTHEYDSIGHPYVKGQKFFEAYVQTARRGRIDCSGVAGLTDKK